MNDLQNLPQELILRISAYLDDPDKLYLSECCFQFSLLRNVFTFSTRISVLSEIKYYNRFINVFIDREMCAYRFPACVKSITLVRDSRKFEHYPNSKKIQIKIPDGIESVIQKSDSFIIASPLPDSIKYLEIIDDNFLSHNVIPMSRNLEELYLNGNYYQYLSLKNILPFGLKKLTLDTYFNLSITDSLPESLISLKFGQYFDNVVINNLPKGLLTLEFGRRFNKSIAGTLPQGLQHLKFGYFFNQPVIGFLPKNLIRLEFDSSFDQPIEFTHLDRLEYLKFGYEFNQPIINRLPHNLSCLKFGFSFNQSITSGLPSTLLELKFGFKFSQSIRHAIPINVRKLRLGTMFNHWEPEMFPQGLTCVELHDFDAEIASWIPPSVSHLKIGGNFVPYGEINLPPTVTHLSFSKSFNRKVIIKSTELLELKFGHCYNQSFEHRNDIPESVRKLVFGATFNQSIIGKLPQHLTHLTLGQEFNQPFSGIDPDNPVKLVISPLGEHFSSNVIPAFPETLQHLNISKKYNKHILRNSNLRVKRTASLFDDEIQLRLINIIGSECYKILTPRSIIRNQIYLKNKSSDSIADSFLCESDCTTKPLAMNTP